MEGYPPDWDRRRRKVYNRDNYECQNCGRTGGPRGNIELHCHHIVPKAKGGSHELSNLTTVCAQCHDAIHGDSHAPSRQATSGALRGHVLVFVLVGWWTLGIANLIYDVFREPGTPHVGEDGRPRLGKRDETAGFWQRYVDSARNRHYGGCPDCGAAALTVSWIQLTDGSKAKVIECTDCRAKYEEEGDELVAIDNVSEVASSQSAVLQELFG